MAADVRPDHLAGDFVESFQTLEYFEAARDMGDQQFRCDLVDRQGYLLSGGWFPLAERGEFAGLDVGLGSRDFDNRVVSWPA